MADIERVLIEDKASAEDAEAVAEAFARAGIDVEVDRAIGRKAAIDLPWIVAVPLGISITAFLTGFFSEAGKDGWQVLKALVRDLATTRSGAGTGEGSLELRDPDGSRLVLPSSISDEGIEALSDIDFNRMRSGSDLMWDRAHQVWTVIGPFT